MLRRGRQLVVVDVAGPPAPTVMVVIVTAGADIGDSMSVIVRLEECGEPFK